ncbi:MAG: type II toxin-antitoxin system YafQ family toxin [Lachnospiraceae bacterium]|nr:type II toxin-antitoxin system YafQ family toxin [Lachnospiraceae bacterium]
MNPLILKRTAQFKKDLRNMAKQGADLSLLDEPITLLLDRKPLPEKYHDHALIGNWAGYRECHIQPDWLFIYRIDNDALLLIATRTGSHSKLFA